MSNAKVADIYINHTRVKRSEDVWQSRADGVKPTMRNTIQMLFISSVTEMSEVFSVEPAATNCGRGFIIFLLVLSIR